jgi:drug/metabolite transporter (DMT)-like permease
MDAYLFNGTRFLIGGLVLLPLARRRLYNFKKVPLPGIALAGAVLFAAAALQQLGLQYTTAGNAGFITGLYVVLVPLILAAGWRQQPSRMVWVAAGLAAAGLFLLSTAGQLRLAAGDALEFAGAILWAFHVILISRLVRRMEVLQLAIGQNIVCGLLNIMVVLVSGAEPVLSDLAGAGWAVLYTGVFSIGVGYTLQVFGQKVAPPADAAILLSMEAVFAALFGWALLGERLALVQLLGCGLMVTGMVLAQADHVMGARGQNGLYP